MKSLDEPAHNIFLLLIEGLKKPGDARKIDNSNSTFMAVHVDYTWKNEHGSVFAVAHHYIQNGDVMQDPDMTFLVTDTGIYPMTFQQDSVGIYQEAVEAESGQAIACNTKLQADLASFANDWMRNIQEQQDLKLPSSPKPQLPSANSDPSP